MFQHWTRQLRQVLWPDDARFSGWREKVVWLGRLLYRVSADFFESDIGLRAMSLVFTTLLALVPLLAVSFSVLKGFGVHNQMEPLLLQLLEPPMGEKGVEITGVIIGFVENIKVGVLGTLGLALLFYSAFSLIQKVEEAFNNIWRLKQSRALLRRMSDYLSVLVIGPVLIFSAIGLSATLLGSELVKTILEIEPLGHAYRFLARLVPYLLIVAAFTFFYVFIPNTRVKFRAALIGGVVSGAIWQFTSWLFAVVIVSSAKYSAIYSGFATLIFLMIWVNLNWLILLLGADLVYHIQHAENLSVPRHRLRLSIAGKENLALQLLCVIGQFYYQGHKGAEMQDFVGQLKVPEELVAEVLDLLVDAGLINECISPITYYCPARPFDETSVKFALDSLRQSPSSKSFVVPQDHSANLRSINQELDGVLQKVAGGLSLKQLAMGSGKHHA